MSNNAPKGTSPRRIRSLRPSGNDIFFYTARANAPAETRKGGALPLSRLAYYHGTGTAAFLNWVIPYLRSPLALVYILAAMLVVGGILDATFRQAAKYLNDGYAFYAPFVYCQDPDNPHLSFWHHGLNYFVAPLMGLTTACIAGMVLAYISIGVGMGVVIWHAGWRTSNFSRYVLPGIIALIQFGLMVSVFKRAADSIFRAVIWLYTIIIAAFWAFLLLFTCATWVHWFIEWSMRPAR